MVTVGVRGLNDLHGSTRNGENMNRRFSILSLLIFFALVVLNTSCVSSSKLAWNIEKARNNLNQLDLGMKKDEVLKIMGPPYNREVFPDKTGNPVEVLIYITQYTYSGRIPDSDKTPICLRNGKLVGWGRNFFDHTQEQEITIKYR